MAAGDISDVILATLRARLGDRDGSVWSDAELFAFLNEGFMEMALHMPDGAIPQLSEIDSTALIAGTSNYDLPTDFLRARIVKYKGIVAKHWPSLEKEALRDDALLVPSESNPFWYLENNDLYVVVGGSGPTQAGAETVELWYMRQPTVISTTVDPDLHASTFDIVQTYAHSRCMEPQGDFGMAKLMRAHFVEECDLVTLRWQTPEAFEGIAYDPVVMNRGG